MTLREARGIEDTRPPMGSSIPNSRSAVGGTGPGQRARPLGSRFRAARCCRSRTTSCDSMQTPQGRSYRAEGSLPATRDRHRTDLSCGERVHVPMPAPREESSRVCRKRQAARTRARAGGRSSTATPQRIERRERSSSVVKLFLLSLPGECRDLVCTKRTASRRVEGRGRRARVVPDPINELAQGSRAVVSRLPSELDARPS